jgi:hypothetical protein
MNIAQTHHLHQMWRTITMLKISKRQKICPDHEKSKVFSGAASAKMFDGNLSSHIPLQYWTCVKKLIKLFDSQIENSCRNMNIMFHATFTVKHTRLMDATSKINY